MSIADKLTKLETDITSAYAAVQSKGGTIPQHKNTDSLSSAISSIPSGGVTPTGTINITTNGTHNVTNYANANVSVPFKGDNFLVLEGDATTATSSATDYQQIIAQNDMPQEFLSHWQESTFGIVLIRTEIQSDITTGNWYLSQKVGNNSFPTGDNGAAFRISNGTNNTTLSTYQFKDYHTYDNSQFNGALCYEASYGLRLYQKASSYHHPAGHWVLFMFW